MNRKKIVVSRGLTLVELLVATSLSLILLLSGAAFYGQVKQKIPLLREAKLIQQRARIALDVLNRLTTVAGLSYCREETASGGEYLPVKYDGNKLTIQTTIPKWNAINYQVQRVGLDSNEATKKISQCGAAEIVYYVVKYEIKLDGTDLKIRGFRPGNTLQDYVLISNVETFNVEFGLADDIESADVSKYSKTLTSSDETLLRTIKYKIKIKDSDAEFEPFALTRVVRLQNPILF